MVVPKIWAPGTHVCMILPPSVLGRLMQRIDATAIITSFHQMTKAKGSFKYTEGPNQWVLS